jgi:hypothetical protein
MEVFVDKTVLFNILGPATLKFAMFMAGGTQEGTAFRILIDNIEYIDLNCDMVQQQIIPMLLNAGVFDQSDVDRIQNYINQVMGV